jgi:hypothetical protein
MFTNLKENYVLCGRGGLSNQHPGNRIFRRVANENKELYLKCDSSSRKNLLVVSIIKAIHHHGGRFVRKQGDSWVEISHKDACVKTSQALRDASEPSDTGWRTSSSKSKTVIRQKLTSKSEQPQNTTETTSRKVSDVSFQASPVLVESSDGEVFPDQEPQVPAVVEYSLADFLGVLLVSEVEDPSNTFVLIPSSSDCDDLSPLGLNEFLFQSRSEYEDLCRGLADSLCR